MKIRKCVVCKAYTLEMKHCGKLTIKAHTSYKTNDKYIHLRIDCKKYNK